MPTETKFELDPFLATFKQQFKPKDVKLLVNDMEGEEIDYIDECFFCQVHWQSGGHEHETSLERSFKFSLVPSNWILPKMPLSAFLRDVTYQLHLILDKCLLQVSATVSLPPDDDLRREVVGQLDLINRADQPCRKELEEISLRLVVECAALGYKSETDEEYMFKLLLSSQEINDLTAAAMPPPRIKFREFT
jgi:hypothetical protein